MPHPINILQHKVASLRIISTKRSYLMLGPYIKFVKQLHASTVI